MGNSPSESKANSPNLSCHGCSERLLNMESFDDSEEQDTYRGRSVVFFKGLYYRIIGEDGIYYCRNCFFEPQRKAAEERRKEEEMRLSTFLRFKKEREEAIKWERKQEGTERYGREEKRRLREQETVRQRELEERLRREQEKRRRREQEERLRYKQENLIAFQRDEKQKNQSRNLLERMKGFQREDFLDSDRDNKVFVLKGNEGKAQARDFIQIDKKRIFSHDEISTFNEFLKEKEKEHDEFEESEEWQQVESELNISDEMLKLKRELRGIADTNEKTLSYLLTITHLVKYSDKDAEEDIYDILWRHHTFQDLELILDIVCSLCSFSRKASTATHLEWIQRFLGKLSETSSSIFHVEHMRWVENQWWQNEEEIEEIFRYLHDDKRRTSWPPPQIWRLSKLIQTANSKEALACFKLIPQFAIPSQISIESKPFLDFLHDNVLSSPEYARKTLLQRFLNEKDMNLDQLLLIMDAPESEKKQYKDIVEIVLNEITHVGYPGELKCFDTLKKKFQLKKSPWDALSLTALVTFKEFQYWPRISQLLSCAVMLSKQESSGRLLQIQTGEGKSTLIAMVAAVKAMLGSKIDVITSSPVLAKRDSEQWRNFYTELNLQVSENTSFQDDDAKKEVYSADIVYGTVSSFSGDILRNDFLSKDIRGHRNYHMVIVDEVDSMLVDNGVQFNYLSHNLASSGLRHLEPLLALIWKAVSDHAPVITESEKVLFRGNPEPFHIILYNLAENPDNDNNWSPAKLIQLAHERLDLFTEEDVENWQSFPAESVLEKVEGVSEAKVISFFKILKDEFGIPFQVYKLNDSGVAKTVEAQLESETDDEIPILVLGNGQTCRLNRREMLLEGIKQFILHKIPKKGAEVADDQIKIPSYLIEIARKKVNDFVGNAFAALGMKEGREYAVRNGNVLPISFKSTGVIEQNMKWGDGLQQFLEMKHRLGISALGLVTNFISNLFFFKKYGTNILGVSGTLGTNTDKEFMKNYYQVKEFYIMPSNKTRKLIEYPGILLNNESEWKKSLIDTVENVIASNRAVLIICEDITTVELIRDKVAGIKQQHDKVPIIYAESNNEDQMIRIQKQISEGEIIIATNLAGRGTDIKVSETVLENGGLFVLMTFLPTNGRVELQASGRAGRKGEPGSSRVILNRNQLPMYLRACTEIEEIRLRRDEMEYTRIKAMKDDIALVLKKEALFSKYCELVKQNSNEKLNESYRNRVLNSLHETWAIWLDDNRDQLRNLNEETLCLNLKAHLRPALQLLQAENLNKSPNENAYHVLLHGAEMVMEHKQDAAIEAFQTSIDMEIIPSSIARYNMAFSLLEQDGKKNLETTRIHLEASQSNLNHYKEDISMIKELVDHSYTYEQVAKGQSLFQCYIASRIQFLQFWENKIKEAIKKIKELEAGKKEAIVCPGGIFSLVDNPDDFMEDALNEFYQMGLLLIFTVKEKPKFCWDALAVFFIGILEVAAGAILIAVTAGTATNIGMGLISEGISDVSEGIEGMVKGTFDWASWGVSKAISFATSLLVGAVGKFLKGGFSAVKDSVQKGIHSIKNVLKSAKTVVKHEIKEGMTIAMKEQLKQTGKLVGKKAVEHGIMYVVQKSEDWLLEEVMDLLMAEVKPSLLKQLEKDVMKEPLRISLLALLPEREGTISPPVMDNCIETVIALANTTVKPYYEHIEWKNHVTNAIQQTLEKAKQKDKTGKYSAIFGAINAMKTVSEVTDTLTKLSSLCGTFTKDLIRNSDRIIADKDKRNRNQNGAGISEQELNFLNKIASHLSEILGDVIFSIIKQGAANHLAKLATSKINNCFRETVKDRLNTSHTERRIKLANDAFQISHSIGKTADYEGETSDRAINIVNTHASNIVKDETKGGIAECKVLADHLGKNISIYKKTEDGKINQYRKVSSTSKSATSELPIKLLYHPPSLKFPDGHYEALDRKNAVIPTLGASKGASCLFEAVHANLYPKSSENKSEIENGARNLRHKVALHLQSYPTRYAEHIEKFEFNKRLGKLGQEYMGLGGARKKRKFTMSKASQRGRGKPFPAGQNITEQIRYHVDDRFVHFYEVLYFAAKKRANGTRVNVRHARTQDHTGAYIGKDRKDRVGSTYKKIDQLRKSKGKSADELIRNGEIQLDASHTTAFYPEILGTAPTEETKHYIDSLTSRTYLSPKPINIGQARDIDKWQIQIAEKVLSSPRSSETFVKDFHSNPVTTFNAHLCEEVKFGNAEPQMLRSKLEDDMAKSEGWSKTVSNDILAAIDRGNTSPSFRRRLNNVRPYDTNR